jgi:hypothetical protein
MLAKPSAAPRGAARHLVGRSTRPQAIHLGRWHPTVTQDNIDSLIETRFQEEPA